MSWDGRFNPEMVVLARTYREMTQKALATAVNSTQTKVSKVEHGLLDPPPEFIDALSDVLRAPRSFFFQPGHIYGLPVRHHRRRKQVAQSVLDRVHAEITIRSMHVGKLLRAVEIQPGFDVPEIDLDETGGTPEDAARDIRRRWQVPRGPIPNLVALLESAGVVVVPCEFGAAGLDAIGIRIPSLPPLMFVNADLPTDRLRFTLAHELGHLVLHSIPRAEMEAEADRFAAELLMPEADIRQHLRFLTVQSLVLMKKIWRVSMGALLKRAQDLQTISTRAAKGLWMYFSRNGWRRREPADYDLDQEPPALLQGLIRYHFDQLDYSVEMLCKVLDWSVEDFRRLYPTHRLRLVN